MKRIALEQPLKSKAASVDATVKAGLAKIKRDFEKLMSKNYFDSVPLDEIQDLLEAQKLSLLQEDNTVWSGLLTGRQGRTNINIGLETPEGYSPSRYYLALQWYKMEGTGKWEVNAYFS